MAQAGDYGEQRSEPWTYRTRIVPLRTYSGRVVHRRARHYFSLRDAERILSKIQIPQEGPVDGWIANAIATLQRATIAMLDRLLPFLPAGATEQLYGWAIDLLDRLLRIDTTVNQQRYAARRIIMMLADRANLIVTIKAPL